MKIDLVTLCDAAVEANGRLHVLGTIDYFWAATVPYVHPKCTLAARVRWEGHEGIQKHRLRVQLVDADRCQVGPQFTRKFTSPASAHVDVPLVRHIIIDVELLRLDTFGPYGVRVEVDGEELAFLPFSVIPGVPVRRQTTWL